MAADRGSQSRFARLFRVLASTPEGQDSIDIGPNWFASVMGTGVIAISAITLPIIGDSLKDFAIFIWLVATTMFGVVTVAFVFQWIRRPNLIRGHANDPIMAQFYGAPPMAMMTIGNGALLAGSAIIGEAAAYKLAWVLWIIGTIGGLITAIAVPFKLFTQYEVRPDGAFGGWLMPVVPPMVSATAGALLIARMAPGTLRETMLYGCYAMFGLSLIASLIIISLIWSRLAFYGSSGTARVPTLWIVLGPLGQSITAAGLLGTAALATLPPPTSTAMNVFAILYGVPVWGFALLWGALASSLTIRTVRRKLPFALTWWSFVFPVGTLVTGTTQLANHTNLPAFKVAAIALFIALISAWVTVGIRTLHGVFRRNLLAPRAGKPAVAFKGEVPPT